ncbi:MAG: ABC transporter permease, partial [Longimicrobiales bacterium]|nr:ABC transporter permease [Longimicrobiales bacterium]
MPELKRALRSLVRSPFVTAVAILSIALGIGGNAAIFSLFDQMLLRPLKVAEPDRLVNVSAPGPKPGSQSCNQAGDCDVVFSYPMFRDLEGDPGPFTGLAAHRLFEANLSRDGETESGEGLLVSGGYFSVLGLDPALGRLLGPEDDRVEGGSFVAVLGYDYWQNRHGGDAGILNRTLIVNGQALTVVGVAPRRFRGTTLGADPDLYVPLVMRGVLSPSGDPGFENRRSYWAYVFGRLAPGASLEQADDAINRTYSAIVQEVEAPLQEGMSAPTLERFRRKRVVLEPGYRGQSSLHAEVRTPLSILFAVTAAVLLIACANIANLLLARGAGRSHDIAIRSSLGAGRARLVRELLGDSVLLAALGGLASLAVARWTLGFIGSIIPPEAASSFSVALDLRVIAFALGLSAVTGVLFGVYPALANSRPDLQGVLKGVTGQASGGRKAARFRTALVTAQITLSVALLVPAGLFIRSLANVSRVELGITEPTRVVTFQIAPGLNGYDAPRTLEVFRGVEEELAAQPGVTSVSASLVPLLAGNSWGTDVAVEGFERGPDIDDNSRMNQVGPGYFSTLGIPLLAGREFDASDTDGAPRVAVVNEAFTRKFGLDGAGAVGKWMSTSGGPDPELDIQIVGVIRDTRYSHVKDPVPPVFYLPYRQVPPAGFMTFYARTALDPPEVLARIPDVVGAVDPNLPVEEIKTLATQVKENVVLDRIISILAAAFALLATALAAVGLYGVLAYSVSQRTREIGLRMALGAGRDRIRRLVLGQMGRLVLVGGALGLALAVLMSRAAQAVLFGVDSSDLVVLAGVTLFLAAVALGAALVP